MNQTEAGLLKREFADRVDAASLQRILQQRLDDRKRRERKEDTREETSDLLDIATAIISTEQAAEFRVKLDSYDVAVVDALHENDLKMERARAELDRIFARAHVLPDGRRVFKTEDGTRVFDEFGQELPPEVIEPDEIADERPRWEVAKDALDTLELVTQERTDILAYQTKLDDARERLDSGKMTQDEYDQLREELKAEMPDAVRAQIPELADKPTVEASKPPAKAVDLDFSGDVVPTVAAAKMPMPG